MFFKIHICALLIGTLLSELFYAQILTGNQINVNSLSEHNQEKFGKVVTNPVAKISEEKLDLAIPPNSYLNQNNRWVSIGPYGGDVRSLAISPLDSNIIYAGTGDGGIYKSENSGLTWSFLQFPNSWSHHLVIHPNNDSILYGVISNSVIAKTTNGGISWTQTQPGFSFYCVTIDKINPDICYGGGAGAIYKTTDGGESGWYYSGLSGTIVYDVAVSPINSSKVFALISPWTFGNSSLYISNDAGLSWEPTQLPPQYDPYVVTPDYSDSMIVYVGANRLFKSTDGGYTWNVKLDNNVFDVAIDPNDPTIVYASTPNNIYKSTDKGETWEGIGIEQKFISQTVIINPQNANTLLTGTHNYGIFITYDQGNNWFGSNTGLDNVRTRDIEIDPEDSKTIYVAADGAGVYKTTNGGLTWEIKDNGLEYPYNTWGLTIAVNPHNNNEVYYGTLYTITTSDWCIYKSTNRGDFWFPLTNTVGKEWVNSIIVDLDNGNSVYAATRSGFMISNNGGGNWNYINPVDFGFYDVIIDPNNHNTFYAVNGWGSGIYKSTNKGLEWVQKNNGIDPILYTKGIAVNHSNTSILYAGSANSIYKTENGADSWYKVFQYVIPTETMALLVNYANPSFIYAGTYYNGLLISCDGGTTWSVFNDGFYNSNSAIYALGSSPAEPHIIYAATLNHSIYKYYDTTLVSVDDEKKLHKSFSLSQNYPNPFNPSTVIAYQLPVAGDVTLKVYDVLGREVATLVDEYKEAGYHEVDFQLAVGNKQYSSGIYYYQLRAGNNIATKKMMVIR